MSVLSFKSDYPSFWIEMNQEEQAVFSSCADNMISHLDKSLANNDLDHKSIGKLMTFRWLLKKNIHQENN